jgi:hypothetical protein
MRRARFRSIELSHPRRRLQSADYETPLLVADRN